MFLRILRIVSRFILRIIAHVETYGFENAPQTGPCIAASNHLGRLDAMLAFILTDREDIVMPIAEKYQYNPVWRWFGERLNAVWLNRFDVDFHAMREVYKRLKKGEMLTIAPEGTRSPTGAMIPAKPGAAYLAAKTGAPIIPVAIYGTEDKEVVRRLKRLKRLDITIRVGEPFTLPPLSRHNRDEQLQAGTDEIMCRIAAMLPEKYRGVYATHPRLQEILGENGRYSPPKDKSQQHEPRQENEK
ncbi:MAG: 1-acyl-sn-glycerol-3-phosphate acyltransferase [Chloroflexi bacterium]|nr:MAG: 1-acyl-sn-glycerol-3-phosphate acyltransferase [Chloroflexota bacterium]